MDQNTFLYTIPQWFIFASVVALAYGWIEKKKMFNYIGLAILVILGLYALYAIVQGYFIFHNYLSPEEFVNNEFEDEIIEEMPLVGKILPAYWLFMASGLLAIPGLFLEWKKKKHSRTFMIIAALVALSGFFMIVTALKA
ncbi:MAG: hypothetical protein HQ541_23385 [Mariniphaga sp.]|nr:hypothetical protein [Mariniphaga sp.]